MVHRNLRFVFVVSLAGVALTLGVALADEERVGSETCAACHEDVAKAFQATAHAMAPNWDAEAGCESCHGPGAEHAESGGEVPLIRFPELSPREASQRCLTCHNRQEKHFASRMSLHGLGDVGCTDCHSAHLTTEHLLRKTSPALCADCHGSVASQFELPRAHPVEDCVQCHEPHATTALRSDRPLFEQTCGECHFEKTAPFIYSHDVVMVDGCAACHEVHGSSNRHLLKHEPQVNLCYQCHSASVTPTWHSAPRFLNEKCTACHTAIHGSNTSPFFLEE